MPYEENETSYRPEKLIDYAQSKLPHGYKLNFKIKWILFPK